MPAMPKSPVELVEAVGCVKRTAEASGAFHAPYSELVVGADSAIGAALLRRLQADGRPVVGTSRRPNRDRTCQYLDLAEVPEVWAGPDVSVVYLCAALARLEDCRRDPLGSAHVNVTGTVRLAEQLTARGAFVVFLSTNHVFDGTRPHRKIDEPTSPCNEYGRQKAEAERRLLQLPGVAVVRLTKVLGEANPLFAGWLAGLAQGRRIQPFCDMVMAPVPLETVTAVLQRLGERRRAGVWHLSGERDVSYAEAARWGARVIGADAGLIEPVTTRLALPSAEEPARHTTLDIDLLPELLGVAVPDVATSVCDAFRRLATRSMRLSA
jgi:dTDP-4-dehydrorhamnose reductase